MKRSIMTVGLLVGLISACYCTLAVAAGKEPNEAGTAIGAKLSDTNTPIETIYGYFSHYSPVIRKNASEAMAKRGAAAMPFIIKALKTGKKYEARAGCDAISGMAGFFGMNPKAKHPITTEMAVTAMPQIVALLDHENFYVRVGALHALSKCGKAAAPYLARVVKLLKDDEWWIRYGASCVMEGVGSPETDKYLEDLAMAVKREPSVQCVKDLSQRLTDLLKTAPSETRDRIIRMVAGNMPEMLDVCGRYRACGVLEAMGVYGKDEEALVKKTMIPVLDAMIKKLEEQIKQSETGGTLPNAAKWELMSLTGIRAKLIAQKLKAK